MSAPREGTLTLEQMVDADKSFDALFRGGARAPRRQRQEERYRGVHAEAWANGDNYPVKVVVGMKMPQDTVHITAHHSDNDAKATVEAPPAEDTFDVFTMLEQLGKGSVKPVQA
ncbi:hypothetical protein [Streptomyces sp. NPDC059176]|uniref:hypothetical protein n=1 Tax=unclassified Streptomyces TaxID=2593676 RepID=UPI0036982C38